MAHPLKCKATSCAILCAPLWWCHKTRVSAFATRPYSSQAPQRSKRATSSVRSINQRRALPLRRTTAPRSLTHRYRAACNQVRDRRDQLLCCRRRRSQAWAWPKQRLRGQWLRRVQAQMPQECKWCKRCARTVK